MIECGYGCGTEAKFPPKKGMTKWCCSPSYQLCPTMKKKFSGKNNPMFRKEPWNKGKKDIYTKTTLRKMREAPKATKGKTYEEIYGKEKAAELKQIRSKHFSKVNKGSIPWNKGKEKVYSEKTLHQISTKSKSNIEDYKKNHPEFIKIERPFIDHDNNIFVKCHYCKRRFVPGLYQLHDRLKAIKKEKVQNALFFCSEKCKNKSEFFNRKTDPEVRSKFKRYLSRVWIYTYRTVKNHKIKNIELRGQEYHLDHRYSVYDGFINSVEPSLIAHKNNLEIIDATKNRCKNRKSSITLQELINITTK